MKKKIFAFTLVILLLLVSMPIFANNGETVTTTATGYNNVLFSNGYYGFCLDRDFDVAYAGDEFVIADTTKAHNNITNTDISQYLKILFVDFFDELFEADGNGGYKIKNATSAQAYVYAFSDRDSSWWDYDPIKSVVEKYNNGRRVADHGETILVDGNKLVTFDFVTMLSTRKDIEQQDFFGYNLTVTDAPPAHEHNFGEDWESNDDDHWHECGCGEKADKAPHNGGTATCIEPSICEECGEPYGEKNPDNHTGGTEIRDRVEPEEFKDGYTGDTYCKGCDTLLEEGEVIKATHEHNFGEEWESDDTNHWHECDCKERTDEAPHNGGTATCIEPSICEECGEPYGEKNPDNHTGGTEIRNQVEPEEFKDGYTGDTYCKGCDTLLEEGEVIKATHEHNFSEEWEADDDEHWHVCSCDETTIKTSHNGGIATCVEPATCEECDKPYGEKDPDNHTGGTEIRNRVEPEGDKDGYTGDTYCKGCDKLLKLGEVIKAVVEQLPSQNIPTENMTAPQKPDESTSEPATEDSSDVTEPSTEDSSDDVTEPSTEDNNDPSEPAGDTTEPSSEDNNDKTWPTIKFPDIKWPEIKLPDIKLPDIKWPTIKNDTAEPSDDSSEPVEETDKPADNNSSSDDAEVPFTGDASNFVVWFAIIILSSVGVIISRKKTGNKLCK